MENYLKIMIALFTFVIIGITSCNKSEFGLNENENAYSESIDANGNVLMKKSVTKEELIKELTDAGRIISITQNFAIPETNLIGTLYKYYDAKSGEKEFIVLDKEPKQEDVKGILPHTHSVTYYWHWEDGVGIVMDGSRCDGLGSGCYGWANAFWVYN